MRVDYDKLAEDYDKHRRGGGPYLDALVETARDAGAARVLEVGAGTGNNTVAFLDAYPCSLTALELSGNMLSQGRRKGLGARWLQASAMSLPFACDSFEFVFGCYCLHYMDQLDALAGECARILTSDGAVAFVTAPVDFIDRHPMNRYFPSFASVDKARFQSFEMIEQALVSAGFREVHSETYVAPPKPINHDYLRRVEGKFISTYALLPEDEFQSGVVRLRADIERLGQLDVPIVWEAQTITAYR